MPPRTRVQINETSSCCSLFPELNQGGRRVCCIICFLNARQETAKFVRFFKETAPVPESQTYYLGLDLCRYRCDTTSFTAYLLLSVYFFLCGRSLVVVIYRGGHSRKLKDFLARHYFSSVSGCMSSKDPLNIYSQH